MLQDVERIRTLDTAGVCVSINTDDPEEFETGYLSNMYVMFQRDGGYTKADMTRLMLNAFQALYLQEEEKQAYIDQLKAYATKHGVDWNVVTG